MLAGAWYVALGHNSATGAKPGCGKAEARTWAAVLELLLAAHVATHSRPVSMLAACHVAAKCKRRLAAAAASQQLAPRNAVYSTAVTADNFASLASNTRQLYRTPVQSRPFAICCINECTSPPIVRGRTPATPSKVPANAHAVACWRLPPAASHQAAQTTLKFLISML